MVRFSDDADILQCEPVLFGALHLPSQVLASGTGGALSGTTFTKADGDFVNKRVQVRGVIHLQSAVGVLDGAYEIVSVDSATQLTVSVVRADGDTETIAPPAATEITYRISTFKPQATEAAFQLTEYFGIQPGNAESEILAEEIEDTSGLRRLETFAVISAIYAMLASKDNDIYWEKSKHYRKLFEKARERCRFYAGDIRYGGSVKLARV